MGATTRSIRQRTTAYALERSWRAGGPLRAETRTLRWRDPSEGETEGDDDRDDSVKRQKKDRPQSQRPHGLEKVLLHEHPPYQYERRCADEPEEPRESRERRRRAERERDEAHK